MLRQVSVYAENKKGALKVITGIECSSSLIL